MTDIRKRGPDRRDFRNRSTQPLAHGERRKRFDQRRMGYLSRLEMFAGVPFAAVEEIIAVCPIRELAAGEVLLRPEERNDNLYFVLDGALEVVLTEGVGDEEVLIGLGGCVGELSMVDGEAVSALVVAREPTQVLIMTPEIIWRRLIHVDKVAHNLLRVLAARMREAKNRLLKVRERQLELQHLQEQLLLARDIQTSMLPDRGSLRLARPGVECVGVSTPALEVGGDFFDVFYLGDDRLVLAIGDVSGKGIAAALLMARTMGMLRAELLAGRDLAEAMARLNAALCVNNERCVFVTAYVAVLELESGVVAYVDAGHMPALVLRGGVVVPDAGGPRGPCLGIMEEAQYQAGTIALAPGDGMLLYTDGVCDAVDGEGTPFRQEGVLATLPAGATAAGCVDALLQAVAAHVGTAAPADDITVLAVRYLGVG